MAAETELAEVLGSVRADAISLAEGVRRLVALRDRLPKDHPLRARLAPFALLDADFDLAREGYADLAEVTARMRAAFDALGDVTAWGRPG